MIRGWPHERLFSQNLLFSWIERLLVLSRLHELCALLSQICLHKSISSNISSLEETDMLHTVDQGLPLWAQGKILSSESVIGTQLLTCGWNCYDVLNHAYKIKEILIEHQRTLVTAQPSDGYYEGKWVMFPSVHLAVFIWKTNKIWTNSRRNKCVKGHKFRLPSWFVFSTVLMLWTVILKWVEKQTGQKKIYRCSKIIYKYLVDIVTLSSILMERIDLKNLLGCRRRRQVLWLFQTYVYTYVYI